MPKLFRGPARQEGPIGGTDDSAACLRDKLAEIGESRSSFARYMKRNGDDRSEDAIVRSINRMANGDRRVPGEMRVLLSIIARSRARRRRTGTDQTA